MTGNKLHATWRQPNRRRRTVRIDAAALALVGASPYLLASPNVFESEVALDVEEPETAHVQRVAVVPIYGPLARRAHLDDTCAYVEGYDAIVARATKAFRSSDVGLVVLAIDSPGGDGANCFEAARTLRALADETGKPLWAAVDGGAACSAAFALAVAADRIFAPALADVGSIGCWSAHLDMSRALDRQGVTVTVVRSGSEKAELLPWAPLSPEAQARMQEGVDEVAQVFAAWVAERRGKTADAWLALKGGVRTGQAAIDVGFVDEIKGIDEVIAMATTELEDKARVQELATLGAAVVATTGTDAGAAIGVVEAWKMKAARADDLDRAEQERAQVAAVEAAKAEVAERAATVRGLVKDGYIAPAVAYADPDTQLVLAEAYASMTMPALRAHATALRSSAKPPALRASREEPTDDPSGDVSAAEAAHCKAKGISVEAFAATKAKVRGNRSGARDGGRR